MVKKVPAAEKEIQLNCLYGSDPKINEYQQNRYNKLCNDFQKHFGNAQTKYFSSPGRTEISGNHTDHNHGKVIAASINLDSIAISSTNDSNKVIFYSEQFDKPSKIDLTVLYPIEEERGTTASLIRGICSGLKKHNYYIGGLNILLSSDIIIGSGLSSSASVEVLIGTIFNHFYNEDKIPAEDIAIISQYAENNFFGKPCGLMDQIACVSGGIVAIDFNDPVKPVIEKINFDFTSTNYSVLVVDTGDNHADLTEEYSSIPAEMKQVARYFNKEYCRDIDLETLLKSIGKLRSKISDRSILRAIHFINENDRVEKQVKALKRKNFELFLRLVNESGNSSFKYLQNIYSPKNVDIQGLSLALALSDVFIKKHSKGACRVHGGGFAGTIQVFLPNDLVDEYMQFMSDSFDEDAVKILSIRDKGAIQLKLNKN
jgi:galactokinase